MKFKLYLESNDTLNDILVYLSGLKNAEIVLILSARPTWLMGDIDRSLFEKHIRRYKLKVLFVAADRETLSLLKASGLKNIVPLKKMPRGATVIKRSMAGISRSVENSAVFSKSKVRGANNAKSHPQSFWSLRKISKPVAGFAVLILIVIGGSLFLSLSRAKVTITLASESLRASTQLVLAAEDGIRQAPSGAIAGRYVEMLFQRSQEFQATGRKDLGGKARGQVTIFNGSDERINLVAGTSVQDSVGHIFKLANDVIIDKAKTTEDGEEILGHAGVEIVAAESGTAQNIGAAKLFFPQLSSVSKDLLFAESELIGGGTEETVDIVSSEDVENASQVMLDRFREEALVDFSLNLKIGEVLLPGLIISEATSINSNVNVGGQAESFKLNVQARSWTVIPSDQDIDKLAMSVITEKSKEGYALVENPKDTLRYQTLNTEDLGIIVANVLVDGTSAVKIDEEALKQNLIGKTSSEANEALSSLEEVISSRVELWPFWVRRVSSNLHFEYLYINS